MLLNKTGLNYDPKRIRVLPYGGFRVQHCFKIWNPEPNQMLAARRDSVQASLILQQAWLMPAYIQCCGGS
jgi:hypothetical protein